MGFAQYNRGNPELIGYIFMSTKNHLKLGLTASRAVMDEVHLSPWVLVGPFFFSGFGFSFSVLAAGVVVVVLLCGVGWAAPLEGELGELMAGTAPH